MAESIEKLRNAELGHEIYIIGSGKSIDFIPDNFWEGKIVIGVNFVPLRIPCKYLITHHYFVLKSFIDTDLTIVTSEREMGMTSKMYHSQVLKGDYYYYKHTEQQFTKIDMGAFNRPKHLITGGTIVTSALHFAYLLGAKTIFLAGVDGGMINGQINYDGYPIPTPFCHFNGVNDQLEKIVNKIREHIPVVSINPFINFSLEGNKYENRLLDS